MTIPSLEHPDRNEDAIAYDAKKVAGQPYWMA